MATATSIVEVPVPSKWDIIPLHTSDRAAFKQCRRKWFWSSPAQANLVPKTTIHGIYPPFWFGTGIHYALQKFYHPILKEDPEVAFDTWYDLQWNGGVVKEEELEQFSDHSPIKNADGNWEVRGLRDILPLPDYDEFEKLHDIGLGMMRYYKDYAEREDDFTVIASEHMFSVPVLDPKTGEPLYMIDTRVMPEDWEPDFTLENTLGPLMTQMQDGKRVAIGKQVHARGRMDLIVQGNNSGNYVIFDHKTTDYAISTEFFDHTDLDEQCTTYIWAAEIEARLYDYPYKDIAGVVYQALRKAYPREPTITTRGLPSMDRQKETTTPQLFEKCVKDLGLESLLVSDTKMQAYYTHLVELGDKQFIWRHDVPRNENQKSMAGLRIYMEALDMLDNPRIYPNPTNTYPCLKCRFRGPCVAMESGYDWEAMLEDGYESNFDR